LRTLQRDGDVEHGGHNHVLLDDVHRQAQAGPVQARVEVAVAVEVVRAEEDVQVTDGVDDLKKN